ncbi:MAG: PBP1A family penicillin-binding protein [Candidatus Dadabacteria bacterium]|nr:MAG: PBP1A family penicillin-binding protein [Candidatus Dadabacteria bacterium]
MKRFVWIVALGLAVAAAGAGAVGYALYEQYWVQLPPIDKLIEYNPPVATRVFAEDGTLVGEFYVEKRYLTPIERIPKVVKQAFVAAEDADFYEHHGIDLTSIARAFIANLRAGAVVQGGSTITQQVVKALLLSPERSYRRKLREIMLSLKLERELTKDQILYLYLNQIYLGDGNYGIGAAAHSYFGKDVSELGLAEAALLAGLPKAPSRYSPTHNPEGALARQRYVLKRMLDEGMITAAQYRAAYRRGLSVLEHEPGSARAGAYYIEYVRRQLIERYGKRAPYLKGFRVYTAMDPKLQALAEQALREGIERLDRELGYWGPHNRLSASEIAERLAREREREDLRQLEPGRVYEAVVVQAQPGKITVALGPYTSSIDVSKLHWHPAVEPAERRFARGDLVEVTAVERDGEIGLALAQTPEVSGALVAIEPATGKVRAMVGGYDFARSQFNRVVQAARQPGSAFKPFVYAAALDNGYTPASIILDAPIQFVDHDRIWRPQNYSRRFYGPTSLRRALEKSRNVVTVRIVQDLGVDTVVSYVERFGFQSKIGRNLSVGLGTSEVTPLELAAAYTAFANAGVKAEPLFITRIEDAAGNLVEEWTPTYREVMSPQTAYLMTSLLEGVVQNGTGRAVKVLNRPVAGKTGTTNEQHDAWFVGFTPDLLAAVWIGYDDHRPLGPHGTGGKVAAPIWLAFMRKALEGMPVKEFPIPEGITCVNIDPKTGLRARENNLQAYLECFKSGTEPQEFEPLWQADPSSGSETLVLDPTPASAPTPPLRQPVLPQSFQ